MALLLWKKALYYIKWALLKHELSLQQAFWWGTQKRWTSELVFQFSYWSILTQTTGLFAHYHYLCFTTFSILISNTVWFTNNNWDTISTDVSISRIKWIPNYLSLLNCSLLIFVTMSSPKLLIILLFTLLSTMSASTDCNTSIDHTINIGKNLHIREPLFCKSRTFSSSKFFTCPLERNSDYPSGIGSKTTSVNSALKIRSSKMLLNMKNYGTRNKASSIMNSWDEYTLKCQFCWYFRGWSQWFQKYLSISSLSSPELLKGRSSGKVWKC